MVERLRSAISDARRDVELGVTEGWKQSADLNLMSSTSCLFENLHSQDAR